MKSDSIKFKVSGDKVFYSLQGEGSTVGQAAIFLRLAMCNLKCKWCDTKYAWDSDSIGYHETEEWNLEKTLLEIKKYKNTSHLVITGGEPLLQQDSIEELIKMLPFWQIEIETNGTISPSKYIASRCQFNVSPKLANSGNSQDCRFKPNVLKTLSKIDKAYFKFVVGDRKDLLEVDQLVKKFKLINDRIIIMPEGTTKNDMISKSISLVEPVKERGWRLVPRLHIIFWGNKRRK
jgi:organic radical activating enzyme